MADEVETSSAVDPSGLLLLCKADTETAERVGFLCLKNTID